MDKSFSDRVDEITDGGKTYAFSKKCKIANSTIRGYLDLKTDPKTIKHLKKMAESAGVRVGWLAAGELPKHPISVTDTFEDAHIIERIMGGLPPSYEEAKKQLAKLYQIDGGKQKVWDRIERRRKERREVGVLSERALELAKVFDGLEEKDKLEISTDIMLKARESLSLKKSNQGS